MRELNQVAQQRLEAERRQALEAELARARRLESTGKLAGGLAHNLNNTLSTIIGNLDLARRASDMAEVQKYAQRAEIAADRATRVVRQLNNLTSAPVIQPVEFDLNELCDDVLAMIDPVMPPSISVKRVFDSAAINVVNDPFAVEQILVNLLLNARDAISGTGVVECQTKQKDAGFELTIVDSGEGMSEALQEHIFEPFYTTKAEQGTGLGLTSVEQLVNALGGNIDLESAEGSGTRFTIALSNLEGAIKATPKLSGRALIVHSNERIRFRLHSVLRRNGMECESPLDPIPAESSGQFDLVLTEKNRNNARFETLNATRVVELVEDKLDAVEGLNNFVIDETTSEQRIIELIESL